MSSAIVLNMTIWSTTEYETGTRRVTRQTVQRQGQTALDVDARYAYDQAGNVLSIADVPEGQVADRQCFDYDWQRRLTEAWTTTDSGCTTPSASKMGASGTGYWSSYTFDADGNRKTEVQHAASGATTTRTYAYASTKPHALESVTSTAGTAQGQTFTYDAAGNLLTRKNGSATPEKFEWDVEGKLKSFTNSGGKKSTYVYDADGDRLIKNEPDATTLYLDGAEVRLAKPTTAVPNPTPTSTRYYEHAGQIVAMRVAGKVKFLASDQQGTTTVQVDGADLSIVKRRQAPFGTERGTSTGYLGERGFVGSSNDSATNLQHMGAREYDAQNGRFISVDPIMDVTDPAQMNGYAYANNSPVTFSDPSGLLLEDFAKAIKKLGETLSKAGSSGGGGGGSTSTVQSNAGSGYRPAQGYTAGSYTKQVQAATARYATAKARVITIVKKFGKIVMDELGITDGLDCLMKGDLGACGATAVNILITAVGGAVAKLGAKYFLNWKKGYKLGKTLAKLGDEGVEAIGDMVAQGRELKQITKVAESAAKGCSFSGATTVLMADGSKKPIKKVKVGDKVIASDPETGEQKAKTVEAVWKHQDTLTDLVVGGRVLTTTEDHPFWSVTDRRFERADQLAKGEKVLTSDGRTLTVTGLKASTVHEGTAYNLTIADIHTYHVGDDTILVHNTCAEPFLDEVGEKYVRDRHTVSGSGRSESKSYFSDDVDLHELADDARKFPATVQRNGNCRRARDAGRPIGIDADTNSPTSLYTVITAPSGRVVTMHPGLTR